MAELEIWPQRPMYFAATIAIHHSGGVALSMGGGTFHGGGGNFYGGVALFMGGGLTLVLTWLKASRGGGIHGGGG